MFIKLFNENSERGEIMGNGRTLAGIVAIFIVLVIAISGCTSNASDTSSSYSSDDSGTHQNQVMMV